jgi:hypothetical protein
MSENPTQQKPLATIWRAPDELWEIIEPILKERAIHQRAPVVLA